MARTNKYTSLNFNDIYEKKFTSNSNNTASTTLAKSSNSNSINSNNVGSKTGSVSNSRIQGHMLVLTRPTPKPISIPEKLPVQENQQPPQQQQFSSTPPSSDQTRSGQESISLRPQGRTGSGPGLVSSHLPSTGGQTPTSPLASPVKTSKFVPPHLRPGFAGREERPGPQLGNGGGPGGKAVMNREIGGYRQGHYGSSPNRFGEDGRPKSGGGYERMRRGDVSGGGGGVGGLVGGNVGRVDFVSRPGSGGARPSSSG